MLGRADWCNPPPAPSLKPMEGVCLVEYQHERVFGIQIGPDGKPTGDPYTFNLQELKQPIGSAVTAVGWIWQPVMIYFG